MADNFLERHHEEYEERKARWLSRKQHKPVIRHRQIERPDDESL
ncbi:MAG: dehydrogenase [Prevotella sp.]|nr:dehydrogenase [Prevotella sp.]